MATEYQIPRHCLAALLLAQLSVLAPHLFRLPIWVSIIALLSVGWRLLLYTGRGFYPGAVLKFLLVLVGALAIWQNYGNLFSLEPIVALLVVTFAFKFIEMKSRRDVYVVIFLAYFVAATHFLFRQSLLDAAYLLLAITLVTGALIALHQNDQAVKPGKSFAGAAKLVFQAVPLTVLMFIVFPRIDPLWAVPGASSQAKTGPSDSMSPGDIANLAESQELAFRVSFLGDMPPKEELYWRGLVLTEFDGRRWTQAETKPGGLFEESTELIGDRFNYTITMEASRRAWLYTLPVARSPDQSVKRSNWATLFNDSAIHQRAQFSFSSWTDYELASELNRNQRWKALSLPEDYNSKTIAYAKNLRQKHSSDEAYIDAVLSFFNRENFVYTLKPNLLARDSVDDFLFNSRRGFCEHYTSSFVVLMRAARIPARVVLGYQGGEVNPYEQYLLVHEFDAHAWAEVWLEGKGWTRVDPTAAVAPERIETSISELLEEEISAEAGIPYFKLRNLAVMRWMRLRWDAVNYSWSRWVLNYDAKRQLEVLERLLGEISGWRIALFVLLCGGAVMALVAISLLSQKVKHKLHPVDKTYLRHARAMQKLGIKRQPSEGAACFAERVGEQYPELAASARRIAFLYTELRYNQLAGQSEKAAAANSQRVRLGNEVRDFIKRVRQQNLSSPVLPQAAGIAHN